MSHTENGMSATDPYLQMSKNTVNAKGQLEESKMVKFDFPEHTGHKVMFVGNSITLHGVLHEIGWHNAWGMAASSKEKDYVHRLEQIILAKDPNASFCICQVADWERQYRNGSNVLSQYENARAFGADIILVRFIENCPSDGFDEVAFKKELDTLLRYLDSTQNARIVITTGFWRHPGDNALRAYAKENALPCVELGDLGEDDTMKAIGLFAHEGVANHPGDLGMQMIAQRCAEQLLPLIKRKETDI